MPEVTDIVVSKRRHVFSSTETQTHSKSVQGADVIRKPLARPGRDLNRRMDRRSARRRSQSQNGFA